MLVSRWRWRLRCCLVVAKNCLLELGCGVVLELGSVGAEGNDVLKSTDMPLSYTLSSKLPSSNGNDNDSNSGDSFSGAFAASSDVSLFVSAMSGDCNGWCNDDDNVVACVPSLSPHAGKPRSLIAMTAANSRTVGVSSKGTFGGAFGGRSPPPVADVSAFEYAFSLLNPVRML